MIGICGGRVVTPATTLRIADVLIGDDGKIAGVGRGIARQAEVSERIDAKGLYVAPGLVDIHVHGSAGRDTMDASLKALWDMAAFFLTHGVTSFCPTTMCMDVKDILAAIHTVAVWKPQVDGAEVLGVHLEGPYINPKMKGAQPLEHIKTPSELDYTQFFVHPGLVKLITVAPEIDGLDELIRYARGKGAAVAIGHSEATKDEVNMAVELGANQATHTFNQMGGYHHRDLGTVGAVLTNPQIYAQVIADGVHLVWPTVEMILHFKGPDKVVLITDAISGAGMPDGEYTLGGQKVTVKDGAVRLPGGTLAGSSLTLDQAVRNMVRYADCSVRQAVNMASLNPARAIGVADRKGSIEPGKDGDIIILTPPPALDVVDTYIGGKRVKHAA